MKEIKTCRCCCGNEFSFNPRKVGKRPQITCTDCGRTFYETLSPRQIGKAFWLDEDENEMLGFIPEPASKG